VSERQIEAGDRKGIRIAFDRLYEQRYAHHSPGEPVEIVNIRLAAIGRRPGLKLPGLPARRGAKAFRKVRAHVGESSRPVSCPVVRREDLGAGARLSGPALVREHGTTTVLFKATPSRSRGTGELVISVRGGNENPAGSPSRSR